MKMVLFCFILSIVPVCMAGPVSNIKVVQDPSTARVSISYDLSTNAIITVGILTNGVQLADSCLRTIAGDVNRFVLAGEDRRIFWFPVGDFTGHLFAAGEMTAVVTAWGADNPPDYLVADLTATNAVRYYVSTNAMPKDIGDRSHKTDKLVMRRIRATGKPWRMGTPKFEKGQNGDETGTTSIPHIVMLTNDYYIGVYEVTQRQYYWMSNGKNPSTYKLGTSGNGTEYEESATFPVEKVSFLDLRGTGVKWPTDGYLVGADGVIASARALTGISTLDLPTEAQWEYACRAGTGTSYNNGTLCSYEYGKTEVDSNVDDVAWYGKNYGNAGAGQHEVGLKRANAWGIYDMHGNIGEACLDWYSEGDAYRNTFAAGWGAGVPTLEPVGPETGTQHVYRGGAWSVEPAKVRSSMRETWNTFNDTYSGYPYGFRLVAKIPVR